MELKREQVREWIEVFPERVTLREAIDRLVAHVEAAEQATTEEPKAEPPPAEKSPEGR